MILTNKEKSKFESFKKGYKSITAYKYEQQTDPSRSEWHANLFKDEYVKSHLLRIFLIWLHKYKVNNVNIF